MAIEFPSLPYPTDALEPYMSKTTLDFHYGKHHKTYVEKLNQLITGTPRDQLSLEDIMLSTFQSDEKIYNNGAQAWNHNFFWNCLIHSGDIPSPEFKKIIENSFGSFEKFKSEFENQAKNLFGSGWIWLAKDEQGRLKIRPMSNAGNPMVEFNETPLLACDAWEHAYYLDYQNERPRYLENFWSLVNWQFVEANLAKVFHKPIQGIFKSQKSGVKIDPSEDIVRH